MIAWCRLKTQSAPSSAVEILTHDTRTDIDAHAVTRALRGGVATLDALAARTGADRDLLVWALEDAVAHGWVSASGVPCGPDGICGADAPVVYSLTARGRETIRA